MIKYTLRSISGDDIHLSFDKSAKELLTRMKDSCTPVSSIEGEPIDISNFLLGEMDSIHNEINKLIEQKKQLSRELETRTKKIWAWKSKKKS